MRTKPQTQTAQVRPKIFDRMRKIDHRKGLATINFRNLSGTKRVCWRVDKLVEKIDEKSRLCNSTRLVIDILKFLKN